MTSAAVEPEQAWPWRTSDELRYIPVEWEGWDVAVYLYRMPGEFVVDGITYRPPWTERYGSRRNPGWMVSLKEG